MRVSEQGDKDTIKLRTGVEIALFLVVFGMGASMLWTHLHPPAAPSAQFTPAPPIPQAAEIKVVTVPGPPQIVTVEKQTVVRDLKLPDEIAKDPDKQVTATAQVANIDGGKTDAVAIMDTKTGRSIIETKEERPFFAFLSQKEAGIRAGIGIHGPEGGLYGRWTFARTGAIHWAVYGDMTAPISPQPIMGAAAQANGGLCWM